MKKGLLVCRLIMNIFLLSGMRNFLFFNVVSKGDQIKFDIKTILIVSI